jgi:hypothetical protein
MFGHHIDEMVEKLRSRGLITADEKTEVREAIASCWTDKIAVVWMYDDFINVANSMGKELTAPELDMLAENMLMVDANYGVNWDTIESEIESVLKEMRD